jgi:uncharacterized membrane protein
MISKKIAKKGETMMFLDIAMREKHNNVSAFLALAIHVFYFCLSIIANIGNAFFNSDKLDGDQQENAD